MFDLDEAPDGELDEELDDEFGVSEEDEDMLEDGEGDEVDCAFASSDDGEGAGDDEDLEMASAGDDEDEEGGQITTNIEDDLDDEGFTLPAVDGDEDEIEHGTSLKDVDARMRWLVGVCCGGEDKVSKGVPGR
jgi:ribosomal RNA methyltransferase Nop2